MLKDGKTGKVDASANDEYRKMEALVHGALKGAAYSVTSASIIDNNDLNAAFAFEVRNLEKVLHYCMLMGMFCSNALFCCYNRK